MHVYNLCRICLVEDIKTSTMQPLFEDDNQECEEIVQRIEVCGGIVLKPHEEFPKMICSLCLDKLNVSYKFRSMCQASENALLDAIIKSELKIEPQEYESKGEYFDMHTEFIDAQNAQHLEDDDITEVIEEEVLESDIEPNAESAEEFIEYTESEYFEDEIQKSSNNKQSTSIKIKKELPLSPTSIQPVTISDNSICKRGRPKLNKTCISLIKTELNRGKISNRGRKRRNEPEISNIMCDICGNIYAKRSLLNMHMRRHMAEKPFQCEICNKTFACPSEISRHMRVHTGEKPYVCKYCGRTFADRSTNIKHERIHTNERPFTCQTCGKSFTYSNVLKNHMLTHTGEKPFPCVPCNKTFSRKHQLDQHIATITHQQTIRGVQKFLEQTQPNKHDETKANIKSLPNQQTISTVTGNDARLHHIIQKMRPHATVTQYEADDDDINIAHVIEEVQSDQPHIDDSPTVGGHIDENDGVKLAHLIEHVGHHDGTDVVYISAE